MGGLNPEVLLYCTVQVLLYISPLTLPVSPGPTLPFSVPSDYYLDSEESDEDIDMGSLVNPRSSILSSRTSHSSMASSMEAPVFRHRGSVDELSEQAM